MIANADKDGTGTLDLIEFLQMMKEKIREQNKEEEIGEAFRVFDIVSVEWEMIRLDLNIVFFQDRNGYIDRRELGLMMKFMGEPVTQEEIDVSQDGDLCQSQTEADSLHFRIFLMKPIKTRMAWLIIKSFSIWWNQADHSIFLLSYFLCFYGNKI